MKKKRNFLTIISSIFGVVAICGLSLFSMLDHKKETQRAEAEASVVVLRSYSSSWEQHIYQTGSEHATFICRYNLDYNKYYDIDYKYGFSLSVDYYFALFNSSGTAYEYSVWNRQVYGSYFNYTYLSEQTTDMLQPNTIVKLTCSDIDFTFVNNVQGIRNLLDIEFSFSIGADSFVLSVPQTSAWIFDLSQQSVYPFSLEPYDITPNPQISILNETISFNYNDYDLGYQDGYNSGYTSGYSNGSNNGYQSGYQQGRIDADLEAQQQISNAYQNGYSTGYAEGQSQDSTVATIFSGILQVAMVPVNFFLAIFNFEILGINLSAFIRAIFTVVLTIIVLKTVLGKGGGSSDN